MAKKSDVQKAAAEARAAEAKAKQADAERAARIEEAKAKAETARAEADAAAAKAKADTDAAIAKAHLDELNATNAAAERKRTEEANEKEAQRQRDADPLRQAWKVGTSLVAPVAGMFLGHKIARSIEGRDLIATRAANKQVADLGEKAGVLLDKIGNKKPLANQARKLEAIAASAKNIKHGSAPGAFGLRALRGPVGLAVAGVLLAEAGIARYYLAPNTPNEQARDVINATATGSIFTATSLIGERVVQNVTMKALPSATALANITAAGEIGANTLGKTALVTAGRGARVLSKLLPGVGIALAVGGAIYAGVKAAHAGESPAVIAREAALGAVGLDGMIPSSRSSTTYLNEGAQKRAEIIPPTRPARSPAPSTKPQSDGVTASYTRRGRNGGVVSVGSYSTPKRG